MKYPELSPSVLFLSTLSIGFFLSWVQAWPLTLYLENGVIQSVGVVLLVISLILNTLAYREFKNSRTPHAPFAIPTVLIEGGIFSLSRNPVYLALVLSQGGLGFVFDTVWLLFSALILLALLHCFIIPEEEKVLVRRFNERYEHYKQHTRRWF